MMLSTVRRPNNDSKDNVRRRSRNSLQILSNSLIVLVIALSLMAIHLSQQIVMQQQIIIASRRTSSSVRQSDAITAWPKKKAISGGVESTQSKKRWAYIHVGKTGGTTLKFVLKSNCNIMGKAKNQRLCRKKLEDLLGPESNLSMATILSIHANKGWMGQYRKLNNALTGFLISVRNPLTRYQSSFYMSHPANPSSGLSHRWRNSNSNNSSSVYFYQTCFQSMEDIATLLQLVAKAGEHSHSVSSKMPVTLTPQQQECYSLAIENLIGNKVGLKCGHCGMNYQYYQKKTHFKLSSTFPM